MAAFSVGRNRKRLCVKLRSLISQRAAAVGVEFRARDERRFIRNKE